MLNLDKYLIKEHVGFLKLLGAYDIFDAESGRKVGTARETIPGWMQALRLVVSKNLMPTTIEFVEGAGENPEGPPVLSIHRGVALWRPRVKIFSADGTVVGCFRAKVFTIGGGFDILAPDDRKIGEVKGDWKGWNFRILDENSNELGLVTKKWGGIGKEFFTSADNYILSLNDQWEPTPALRTLLLAAAIAIDTVFKEKND